MNLPEHNAYVAQHYNPGDPGDNQVWSEEIYHSFCDAMKREWLNAREDFEPFHSLHEGYAVLLEEVKELEKQTFRRPSGRDRLGIVKECIQIATMAFCIADECEHASSSEIDSYEVLE